jgi:dCTP diphosphatase
MRDQLDVAGVQAELRTFASERDWERFHSPKNLAIALTVEAGELLEVFQWLAERESRTVMLGSTAGAVEAEVADVLIYLLRLADILDIDLGQAVAAKLATNAERYPVDKAHGRATKYTSLRWVRSSSSAVSVTRTSAITSRPR